jgi:hypothetical protein
MVAVILFSVLVNSACSDEPEVGDPVSKPVTMRFLNKRYSDESYGFVDDLSKLIEKYDIDESISALDIRGSFSDLRPIEKFSNLKKLILFGCNNIRDISPLEKLTNLEELKLEACYNIQSISALSALPKLKSLTLYYFIESDFPELANCAGLETLSLYGDVLTGAGMENIIRLTGLRDLELDFYNGISNIEELKNLAGLRRLVVTAGQELDVSWIPALTELCELKLTGFFLINDVSPLLELPKLTSAGFRESFVKNLPVLYTSDTIKYIETPLNYERPYPMPREDMLLEDRYSEPFHSIVHSIGYAVDNRSEEDIKISVRAKNGIEQNIGPFERQQIPFSQDGRHLLTIHLTECKTREKEILKIRHFTVIIRTSNIAISNADAYDIIRYLIEDITVYDMNDNIILTYDDFTGSHIRGRSITITQEMIDEGREKYGASPGISN